MSSRARLVTQATAVAPLSWAEFAAEERAADPSPFEAPAPAPAAPAAGGAPGAAEQEAFAQGYAQGERAGRAAATTDAEALQRRFTHSLDELVDLRARMVRQAERDMVQLALAIARRVAHREVSLDRELLAAMARVALDRLSEASRVTIRVHPSDLDALAAARHGDLAGDHVTLVADARVGRGGCRLESECGTIEAGIDAQIRELGRALLGSDDSGGPA